jgi:hypothetical protein
VHNGRHGRIRTTYRDTWQIHATLLHNCHTVKWQLQLTSPSADTCSLPYSKPANQPQPKATDCVLLRVWNLSQIVYIIAILRCDQSCSHPSQEQLLVGMTAHSAYNFCSRAFKHGAAVTVIIHTSHLQVLHPVTDTIILRASQATNCPCRALCRTSAHKMLHDPFLPPPSLGEKLPSKRVHEQSCVGRCVECTQHAAPFSSTAHHDSNTLAAKCMGPALPGACMHPTQTPSSHVTTHLVRCSCQSSQA